MDADLKQALKKSKWSIEGYRAAVATYRNAESKEQKREMEKLIADIKSDFRSEISMNDPKVRRLRKLSGELFQMTNQQQLFEMSKKEKTAWNKKVEKLTVETSKLESEIEEIKANKIFENAFEWRFEFPEVLNAEGDFVGFDVVIGNPPYIRQEALGQWKEYFQSRYEVFVGTADLLVYFFELSYDILKIHANFCMITSNKFVKSNYGRKLRGFLAKLQLNEIVDFGELPVFEEAATFPAIYFFQKKPREKAVRFTQVESLVFNSLAELTTANSFFLSEDAFGDDFWSLEKPQVNAVLSKMKENTVPLKEFIDIEILYGVKTGFNTAFIIDEYKKLELISLDPKSAELIYPFVIGDDVRFYSIRDRQRFIILTKIGVDIEKYPAIFAHLRKYQIELENRWDKGNHWWELRACAYYRAFEEPKLVYPDIAKESRFAYSDSLQIFSNTCYFIPNGSKHLLAILNSKIVWFYFSRVSSVLGNARKGGRLRWFSQDVNKIPIPRELYSKPELVILVNKIIAMKEESPEADTSVLESQIDHLVYQLYDLTEDEIKIIEGA
jgi:hypothetical protein